MKVSTVIAQAGNLVPTGAVLDTWSAHAWTDGVLVTRLCAFDRLIVRTCNSTYELVVVVPETTTVLVRGGAFFPVYTRAYLAGSSLGGSFLKLHGIYRGFRMELSEGGRVIVTSPVEDVATGQRADRLDRLM